MEEFSEQAGWLAEVHIEEPEPSIPARLEPTLFRLVQESLNNAAKHAEASRIWVNVQSAESGAALSLAVRDNGCGFDPEDVTSGLGLNQMRERVVAIGGTVQLKSQPDKGTTVKALIPVSSREKVDSVWRKR